MIMIIISTVLTIIVIMTKTIIVLMLKGSLGSDDDMLSPQ